eukprot:153795_1
MDPESKSIMSPVFYHLTTPDHDIIVLLTSGFRPSGFLGMYGITPAGKLVLTGEMCADARTLPFDLGSLPVELIMSKSAGLEQLIGASGNVGVGARWELELPLKHDNPKCVRVHESESFITIVVAGDPKSLPNLRAVNPEISENASFPKTKSRWGKKKRIPRKTKRIRVMRRVKPASAGQTKRKKKTSANVLGACESTIENEPSRSRPRTLAVATVSEESSEPLQCKNCGKIFSRQAAMDNHYLCLMNRKSVVGSELMNSVSENFTRDYPTIVQLQSSRAERERSSQSQTNERTPSATGEDEGGQVTGRLSGPLADVPSELKTETQMPFVPPPPNEFPTNSSSLPQWISDMNIPPQLSGAFPQLSGSGSGHLNHTDGGQLGDGHPEVEGTVMMEDHVKEEEEQTENMVKQEDDIQMQSLESFDGTISAEANTSPTFAVGSIVEICIPSYCPSISEELIRKYNTQTATIIHIPEDSCDLFIVRASDGVRLQLRRDFFVVHDPSEQNGRVRIRGIIE